MLRTGNLIILSGPSGAGKSALAASILESVPGLVFSISHTTRPPRGSERDGIEYHFVDQARFQELIRNGDFLEWAEVYGNLYGTSRVFVEERLQAGEDVILDVDVQGARTIGLKRPDAVSVFILPPSYQVLRQRLEKRQLDKDYEIEHRLRIACSEIRCYKDYEYLIINNDIETSGKELKAIILGSRNRSSLLAETAKSIVATFGGMDEYP